MLTTRRKIALARLVQASLVAARAAFGRPAPAIVRRGGVTWALDLDEGIDFSIYLLGAFERRTVACYARLVGPGMTAIDVGANVGAHTLPLARLVGETGRVIAFEPTAFGCAKLRRNLDLNPELARRVTVGQTLLADRADAALPDAIYASWPLAADRTVHPKLRARAMPTGGARAATLDAALEALGATRVDFIKLDVDGDEARVLRGARETLRAHRPAIVLELSPYILAERGDGVDALLDALGVADYRLSELGADRPLPSDRARLRAAIPDGAGINVVARAGGA